MVSDGGVAVVLSRSSERVDCLRPPVEIAAMVQQSALRADQNPDNLMRLWLADMAERLWDESGMSPAHTSHNWLYVPDVDATYKQAVAAGMTGEMAPADMFWGDRHARVSDKFGNVWAIATHTEDLSPEEMKQKEDAFIASMPKK